VKVEEVLRQVVARGKEVVGKEKTEDSESGTGASRTKRKLFAGIIVKKTRPGGIPGGVYGRGSM